MERKTQAAITVVIVLVLAGVLLLNEKPSQTSGEVYQLGKMTGS